MTSNEIRQETAGFFLMDVPGLDNDLDLAIEGLA
jgi:hypothetical protein